MAGGYNCGKILPNKVSVWKIMLAKLKSIFNIKLIHSQCLHWANPVSFPVTGELLGDPTHHISTHPRCQTCCPIVRPTCRTILLEHRQLQRCDGNHRWAQVSGVEIARYWNLYRVHGKNREDIVCNFFHGKCWSCFLCKLGRGNEENIFQMGMWEVESGFRIPNSHFVSIRYSEVAYS